MRQVSVLNREYVLFKIITIFLIFIFIGAFHLLFGDPQNSRWHYIVQCYYVPEFCPDWMRAKSFVETSEEQYLSVPFDYTGKWQVWHKNGRLKAQFDILNGRKHGRSTSWYNNGFKRIEYYSVNGVIEGKLIHYYKNGIKELEQSFLNGKQHGECLMWKDDGSKNIIVYYENDIFINEKKWK